MDHEETESTCGIATWPNQEPYDIIQVSSKRTPFCWALDIYVAVFRSYAGYIRLSHYPFSFTVKILGTS